MKNHQHRSTSIDSRNHLAIKRIRRLHLRDERERTGLYYVEGVRFVVQAVQHRVPIETLVVCRGQLLRPLARSRCLVDAARLNRERQPQPGQELLAGGDVEARTSVTRERRD